MVNEFKGKLVFRIYPYILLFKTIYKPYIFGMVVMSSFQFCYQFANLKTFKPKNLIKQYKND